jgi:hypothetical protein
MIGEISSTLDAHRSSRGVLVPVVLRLFVQVIIIRDPTHGDANQQNGREPAYCTPRPDFLLFYDARGKTHATPGQGQDAAQFDVPGHKIEMAFSPDFAPQTDNGNQCDQEFQSVSQAQPCRIQKRRIQRKWTQRNGSRSSLRRYARLRQGFLGFRRFQRIAYIGWVHFTSQRIMFSFPPRYF